MPTHLSNPILAVATDFWLALSHRMVKTHLGVDYPMKSVLSVDSSEWGHAVLPAATR